MRAVPAAVCVKRWQELLQREGLAVSSRWSQLSVDQWNEISFHPHPEGVPPIAATPFRVEIISFCHPVVSAPLRPPPTNCQPFRLKPTRYREVVLTSFPK